MFAALWMVLKLLIENYIFLNPIIKEELILNIEASNITFFHSKFIEFFPRLSLFSYNLNK